MPIDNVVDFILYVLPGFIATEIYYSHYRVKERSALTQLAQSIIGGVLVLIAVRFLDQFVLAGALGTATLSAPTPELLLSILFGGIVLGYIGVGQLSLRSHLSTLSTKLSWIASPPDSIWQFVNQPSIEDWAVVRVKNGPTYLGWITRYRFDPDADDQDFLISQASRVDDQLKPIYSVDGIGVYLNTRDILAIEFVKPPPPTTP